MIRFALAVGGALGTVLSMRLRHRRVLRRRRERLVELEEERAFRRGSGAHAERVRVEGPTEWVPLGRCTIEREPFPAPAPRVTLTGDVVVVREAGSRVVLPKGAELSLLGVPENRQTRLDSWEATVEVPRGLSIWLLAVWPAEQGDAAGPAVLGLPRELRRWSTRCFVAASTDPTEAYLNAGSAPSSPTPPAYLWPLVVGAVLVFAAALMAEPWGSIASAAVWSGAGVVEAFFWAQERWLTGSSRG